MVRRLLLVFSVFVSLGLLFLYAQSKGIAHVTFVKGEVKVLRAGTESWVPAQKDMSLAPGDKIMTGKKGKAVLVYADMSVIKMRKKTLCEPLPLASGLGGVKMPFGTTYVKVNPAIAKAKGIRFQLEGSKAIAGVRGTFFKYEEELDLKKLQQQMKKNERNNRLDGGSRNRGRDNRGRGRGRGRHLRGGRRRGALPGKSSSDINWDGVGTGSGWPPVIAQRIGHPGGMAFHSPMGPMPMFGPGQGSQGRKFFGRMTGQPQIFVGSGVVDMQNMAGKLLKKLTKGMSGMMRRRGGIKVGKFDPRRLHEEAKKAGADPRLPGEKKKPSKKKKPGEKKKSAAEKAADEAKAFTSATPVQGDPTIILTELPRIEVGSPNESITIKGMVTNAPDTAVINLMVNGNLVSAPLSGGIFSGEYAGGVNPGDNKIQVTVSYNGKSASAEESFKGDETSPMIVISNPIDGAPAGEATPKLSGTIIEENIDKVEFRINEHSWQNLPLNGSSFDYQISSSMALEVDRTNSIQVRATDKMGNSTIVTSQVELIKELEEIQSGKTGTIEIQF